MYMFSAKRTKSRHTFLHSLERYADIHILLLSVTLLFLFAILGAFDFVR